VDAAAPPARAAVTDHGRMRRFVRLGLLLALSLASFLYPRVAHAQGGPPYLTTDPGTPGNANWEINIGSMQTIRQGLAAYQVPLLDINFGVGDHIQLSYQVPYVLQTSTGQPQQSGWSNALTGVKWRFFDQGEGGWQISTFPQFQTKGSTLAQHNGIAGNGPRFLLPIEISKKVGPLNFDFEGGYFFPWHGPPERILGLVVGRPVTHRLELDAEIYNDRAMGALPHDTTFDFGGRYKLHDGLILMFIAGRSFKGNSSGQPEFMGYIGVQILLSKYGREWTKEP